MIHLVTGGSSSGKSNYAEQEMLKLSDQNRIYLATMHVKDEESRRRVEKHQVRRRDMNFTTIESPTDIDSVEIPEGANVLLECLSNLVANEMFMPGKAGLHSVSHVIDGLETIASKAENLIIVTNEVFSDGVQYGDHTRMYLEFLGLINQFIAKKADMVTEVVYGIPIPVKRPNRPDISI